MRWLLRLLAAPLLAFFALRMDYPRMNQWKQPMFRHPETGKIQGWIRASTVGKELEGGGDGLINWTGAMVAAGCYLRNELAGQIGARWPMTDENKAEIYKLVEELKDAGGGSVGKKQGDTLHEFLRRLNQGEDIKPMSPWAEDIKAVRDVEERAGITVHPQWVERTVCHPDLGIAGSFDLLADVAKWPSDELLVDDYKTGKVGDYSWPGFVVQLALYANAPLLYNWDADEFEPMPPVSKKRALITHAPAGTATAEIYVVDISEAWKAIKAALWIREYRKTAKHLARPARLDK